jgi:phage-related protein
VRRNADKPLVWLHGEVKTPPFTVTARVEAGCLLRRLQRGESLGPPHSRPMPVVGRRCHELRIADETVTWRIVYRVDADAVVLVQVFAKKTQVTAASVIATCRRRLRAYDSMSNEKG